VNLAENTDEFKDLILDNENYLKAIWNLTGLFKNQIENFKKILSLLRILVELNQNVRFSSRLLKHIKSTIRELEKYFNSSDEQLDDVYDLYKTFADTFDSSEIFIVLIGKGKLACEISIMDEDLRIKSGIFFSGLTLLSSLRDFL
jgi:hypothetical protein